MLVQGELGRNNSGCRAPRASGSSSGSSRARSSTSSCRQVRNCRACRSALHCLDGSSGCRGWIPALQTHSAGDRAYEGSLCTSHQTHLGASKRPGQCRRRTFPGCCQALRCGCPGCGQQHSQRCGQPNLEPGRLD